MEEPFSLFTLQTLLVREVLAKEAPVVFFTWNNLSLDEFDYHPNIWYRNVARWTLPRMHYALTANSDAISVLRKNQFRGPIKNIGYGVDTSIFNRPTEESIALLKSQLSIPKNATIIGYVGRFLEMKGIDLLLRAFGRLQKSSPDKAYTLLLVGNGPVQAALFDQARALGIDRSIRHVPLVAQAEVPQYMSLIDTLVLPSRRFGMWAEQFGRVLVEAMAMRVAVLGSSSGAIPEVIGEAGYVFEENNSDDLFEKLCTIERLAPEEKKQLLDKGEQRARQRYSWSRFAQESHEALHEVYHRSAHP
jgi:glycosyltransferase involved in cell wall biosynthesis